MRKLLRKEFIVNRNSLFITLLVPLFSIIVIINDNKLQSYIMFSYAISSLTIITVATIIEDKRSKGTDILFLSLPVNRDDLVKSKYIIYSLFPLIFSITLYIFVAILNWPFNFQYTNLSFDVVIISTSITLIILGFVIPIMFKWSRKRPIMGSLFYILFLLGNYNLPKLVLDLDLSINFGLTSIILSIFAIIAYLVSMKVSINIYKNLSSWD